MVVAGGTPKSHRSCVSQVISLAVATSALYSDSAEDLDTTVCFFAFQEIGALSRHM